MAGSAAGRRIVSQERKKSNRLAKYVKPRVRTYRIYEQQSLGCGKITGGAGQCRLKPSNS